MGRRVLVAQLGARMHYAVPRVLHAADRLGFLCTDICASRRLGWLLARIRTLMPLAHLERLACREPVGVPPAAIKTFDFLGIRHFVKRHRATTFDRRVGTWIWIGSRFASAVATQRDFLQQSDAIYAFNGAALELFMSPDARCHFKVLEQTIAPFAVELKLLREIEERYPGWQLPVEQIANANRFKEREAGEWELADRIICASAFVRESIAECGGPAHKCVVVPYGVKRGGNARPEPRDAKGMIRVLTVGQVGLRKGAPVLHDVAKRLRGRAVFRVVGASVLSEQGNRMMAEAVNMTGVVPRNAMHEHYAWADVFLLPSVCEGSATVTYEALNAGLPVICTPNAGAPVQDGFNGFIVSNLDVSAMVERIEELCDDQSRLEQLSANARNSDYTSEDAYGERLIEALDR
ncbi:MAG: glycoside hydrolase [Planctomycetota bacterium]|nr:MAG: glycoside hydrolase [Planctomycetota bacterium]